MTTFLDADYQQHMASIVAEGFTLDPAGYERLRQWTQMLMQCVSARASFERLNGETVRLGDINEVFENQAFFVAGVMAYCRCYGQS